MIFFVQFLGILVNFISHPVINAFTSAAAITIAFGQVKVGRPENFSHFYIEKGRHGMIANETTLK